jgi:hypothetical protein
MRPRGFLAVNAAADMAGRDRRAFRLELQALHEKHGKVIYRYSPAPNAKLWTTIDALKEWIPEAFGDVTALDILELREMVVDQGRRLTRIEKKVNTK